MPEALLKVPTDWSPLDSVAYMLLCVSIADGSIEGVEMKAVRRLVGQHGQVDEEQAGLATARAFAWLRHVFEERGRDGYLASLRSHATRLANHYGPQRLKAVVGDMLEVARADGNLEDAEVVLIQTVASDWKVSDDA